MVGGPESKILDFYWVELHTLGILVAFSVLGCSRRKTEKADFSVSWEKQLLLSDGGFCDAQWEMPGLGRQGDRIQHDKHIL